MDGGKVLGSGTYGCLLKPAALCKNETQRQPDTVSKLMTRGHAEEEYDEITRILDKIKHIPNHNEYYILGNIRMCELGTLTNDDLEQFNRKCHAMTKRRISKMDVKNNPQIKSRLRILQLPDGGKDITEFFAEKSFSTDIFVKVNNALVKLLIHGISPLQKNNVIHQDIKGNNVVYSQDKDVARLIDWGLATIINGRKVPIDVKGWPIMFNQPFVNIVLHNETQNIYKRILLNPEIRQKISDYRGDNLIGYLTPHIFTVFRSVVFSSYDSIQKINGNIGHINYIERILTVTDEFDDYFKSKKRTSLHHPKFDVLADILAMQTTLAFLHFSVSKNRMGKFSEYRFFNNIFKKNCDIFGFISIYIDVFLNTNAPRSLRKNIYEKIVKTFYFNDKFAYLAFNVKEIASACLKLNDEFKKTVTMKDKRTTSVVPPPAPLAIETSNKEIKELFTWSLRKRCPKGSRRDKKTKKCVRTRKVTKVVKKDPSLFSWPKTKRCPKGSRRDKKTQKCKKI